MNTKQFMYITYAFFIAAFICLIIEGFYYNDWFLGIVNSLTGYNVVQISSAGIWALPKAGWGFLTHGIPTLMSWDYSYFQGGWIFFRFLLILTLSAGLMWGIIQTIAIPLITGLIGRIWGG